MMQRKRKFSWKKELYLRTAIGLPILLFVGINFWSSIQGFPFSVNDFHAFAPPPLPAEYLDDPPSIVNTPIDTESSRKLSVQTFFAEADAPLRPLAPPSSCTSPESNVSWPFQGKIQSINPQHTCGLRRNRSPLTDLLIDWNEKQLNDTNNTCPTVIYGAAFGGSYLKSMLRQKAILKNRVKFKQRYGKCFYIFALQSQLKTLAGFITFFPKGIQLIGVPEGVLPFSNNRRNVKLFKFLPQILFPKARKVIWQDMKFFRGEEEFVKQPTDPLNVYEKEQRKHDACLITTSLPVNLATVGNEWRYASAPHMELHCKHVVEALKARPDVTDSPQALQEQCTHYFQNMDPHMLDQGMIDSAFMVWHFEKDECKEFNARLQCEILNQVHCFSDRDQISIPYALALMNLTKKVTSRDSNALDNPRYHGYQLVQSTSPEKNMVHVIQSACHWYFHRIGDCIDDEENGPSLAVMVSGRLRRFQLKSTFDHLLIPAKAQSQVVDYFVTLSLGDSKIFQQGNYSKRVVPDPFLRLKKRPFVPYGVLNVYNKILEKFWSEGFRVDGNSVRLIDGDGKDFDSDSRINMKNASDPDYLKFFPTYDARPDRGNTSVLSNSNMLSLLFRLEKLYTKLLGAEQKRGKKYDYILILRDDTLWMKDFSLRDVLSYGRQNSSDSLPDAFVLSCDAREPALAPLEVCDHAILVHRSKAHIFTQYFTTLLNTDLSICNSRARRVLNLPSDQGCNSEMILHFIAEINNVSIQKVPQSLFPFQRALTVKHPNGTVQQCLHKFCQSHELPLEIASPLEYCTDIVFNTTDDPLPQAELDKLLQQKLKAAPPISDDFRKEEKIRVDPPRADEFRRGQAMFRRRFPNWDHNQNFDDQAASSGQNYLRPKFQPPKNSKYYPQKVAPN